MDGHTYTHVLLGAVSPASVKPGGSGRSSVEKPREKLLYFKSRMMSSAHKDLCPFSEAEKDTVFFLLTRPFSLWEIYINPVAKPQVRELKLLKIPGEKGCNSWAHVNWGISKHLCREVKNILKIQELTSTVSTGSLVLLPVFLCHTTS